MHDVTFLLSFFNQCVLPFLTYGVEIGHLRLGRSTSLKTLRGLWKDQLGVGESILERGDPTEN